MQFSKIKYREKDGVELTTKIKADGGVVETRDFSCAAAPNIELPNALAAFIPFVCDLLDLPDAWREHLTISTLSIDEEPKTKKAGLIVTALLPIEKANDRLLVLNTPRMREGDSEAEYEIAGTFDESVMDLIEAAQKAARAYYRGERGDQLEMLSPVETVKAADAKAAETTNGTQPAPAPKIRRQKKLKIIEKEGAGRVMNPEASVPPTDEVLQKQLMVSGVDVPLDRIAKWVHSDRESALKWAQDPDGKAAPFVVRRDAVTMSELAMSQEGQSTASLQ